MNVFAKIFLLGAMTWLTGGCVTSALWDADCFSRLHEPALPTSVRLFASPARQDILVQYDEWVEGNERVRSRTYWLDQSAQTINPHKPRFVSSHAATDLAPIPINDSPPSSAVTNGELSAMRVNSPPGFVLYSGRQELGRYCLPVYEDASGTVIKVVLTPFAVTADAAILAAYLYLLSISERGCSGLD